MSEAANLIFQWVFVLNLVKHKLFHVSIVNTIHNFIPFERTVCGNKDPPWISSEIKNLISEKNLAYCRFNRDVFLSWISTNQLYVSIKNSKQTYYSKLSSKLANPATSSKTYWSILKFFLNNKKIPCIPPLFHENKFITNFKEKAELFNTFFANQCTLLNNSSVLPNNLAKLTNKSLDTVNFSTDDISKIINNLDPNKAHGHDMLSIRMIKLCGNSICKPLSIIFNDCLKEGKFPWKKAHVVLFTRKETNRA